MSTIHRLKGDWGDDLIWEGARTREYSEASSATETWLIGKAERAENFAMRYYRLGPAGASAEEAHPYDHGILFLHGSGEVLLGDETHPVSQGDVLYISPDERHQIRNSGEEPLGWLCVIPARRRKAQGIVWAEEGLDVDTT